MEFLLYTQLMKLDRSNDHMLRIYQAFYSDIPAGEEELTMNVEELIKLREQIKLKLRGHLFSIRNALELSRMNSLTFLYLPIFVKMEYVARRTFSNTKWEACYVKDQQCMKLYLEILYSQNVPAGVVKKLLQQKRRLYSLQ